MTEHEIEKSGLKHVELIPVDNLDKFMKYSSKQYFYLIWQYLAYRTVKKKNLRLDVIHCYSLSDFRFPGFWSNMKGAYTIFGPVGGGQRCPKALIRWQYKEKGRNNWITFSWQDSYDTAEFKLPILNEGRLTNTYRCKITGEDGSIIYTQEVFIYSIKKDDFETPIL